MISDLNMGTIIIDWAAIFLLVGVLRFTALYRKRGRTDDRLFFCMILTDLVLAAVDSFNFALEYNPDPLAGKLILCFDTIFTICFQLFWLLFLLYMDFRVNNDRPGLQKRAYLYALPFAVAVVMAFGNLPFHYLFYVNEQNGYVYAPYYSLVFAAPVIYAVLSLFFLLKLRKTVALLYLLVLAVRIYGAHTCRGVSSTAFVLAVGLVFAHIVTMNQQFYAETQTVCENDVSAIASPGEDDAGDQPLIKEASHD